MTMAEILHADLDAFYASVEQRDDPSLRGKPMAVGGGVILAASYEARAFGVRTAMGGAEARRRCPDLISVSPRMDAYAEASKRVFEIFHDTSPLVEGLSIDEAFIDVTGLRRIDGPGARIGARLKQRVLEEVGLCISVGVASTKFLAKVASAWCKPDGLLVVPDGGELEFLHPLPVRALWGVGPKTEQRLNERGLHTVGDVAALEQSLLVSSLGVASGRHVHALANNLDPRPIEVGKRRRSVGSQRSFPSGGLSRTEAEMVLLEVTDRVTGRLRDGKRVGRTVVLRLRFGDFSEATRSDTLPDATASTDLVGLTARRLLATAWDEIAVRGLTRVGIAVADLTDDDAVQLSLPFGGVDHRHLDEAVDQVRDRFGKSAIGRTALLGRSTIDMPLLPDHR
ncbi:MAG: DNA polymerase-4 [Acidimicrobiales bacterium]|jgi:DNA polymerase-4